MLRKFLWTITAACFLACPGLARAGETDLLVQKLVDKGILTPNEAQILMDETKQDVAKQNAKGTNDAVPTWVQTTKIKGDTRVRYEYRQDKNSAGGKTLSRERLRVRLGLESKINDQTKVGIGVATGRPGDPRSRNITLGSSGYDVTNDNTPASGKSILLDYAYAQYTPFDFATLIAGKFQNPLWQPNDMIWKGDITPEGFAVNLNYNLTQNFQVFMNNMAFILRNGDTTGAYNDTIDLAAFQPGFNWAVADGINMKGAAAYYRFQNIYGSGIQAKSSGTNSTTTDGLGATVYKYGYDSVNPSLELGFKNPFGETMGAYIPYASVFGDYIYNVDSHNPSTGRGGFDSGVKVGYEKVADKNQWQLKLAYSKLGRDAWLDIFTDSDRYQGRTNTRAGEAVLEYGLGKNSSLVLDYYYATMLNKSSSPNIGGTPEQLVQLDWNLKF